MNASVWIVILLAVVQGLTEFFPVSSSGHLVIIESLFGMRGLGNTLGVVFEVAVHLGTLGAVIVFYRKKVRLLCRAFFASAFSGGGARTQYRKELGYIGFIVIGSIPAGIFGVAFKDQVEAAFNAPDLTAVFLVATGLYLLLSGRRPVKWNLTWYSALIIGCAQAIAVLPGCSRSGWTIATGLLLGVGFAEAAEFSFMLSIPAILGATALELIKAPVLTSGAAVPLTAGVVVSFLAGLLALRLLIGILNRGAFHRFAYYLLPVGAAAVIYFRFLV